MRLKRLNVKDSDIMGNMNRLFIYIFAFLTCVATISCDEKNTGEVNGVFSFSEIKELDLSLLESEASATGYFTLEASGKCVISSDRLWVTFATNADDEFTHSMQCDETVDTVFVKVSNGARDFVDANAVVTLFANGEEQVVATISRSAISYQILLKDNTDTILESISINDKATAWICFDANFECGIIEYPEWLMEPVAEDGGYRLDVVAEAVPMEQSGSVVVSDRSMTRKYEFPVVYEGMNPKVMRIDGDSPWGWNVSLDGKEFKKKESSLIDGEEDTVVEGGLNMTVLCRDYSYKTIFLEYVSETLLIKDDSEAWIKAVCDESEPQKLFVTVDECKSASSRSGYLFALPVALYDEFKADVAFANENGAQAGSGTLEEDNEEDTETVWDKFWNKYEGCVLAEITQKDQGFRVTLVEDETETEIVCESDENADYYIKINGEYTITDIMACDVELGKSYVINTKLTADDCGWTEDVPYYEFRDIDGKEIREKYLGYPYVDVDENGYFRVYVEFSEEWNDDLNRNVVMRLYTRDVVNIKALVLRIQE